MTVRHILRALLTILALVPGAAEAQGPEGVSAAAAARLDARIAALEEEVRATTGRIEELGHRIGQLEQRLDKVLTDLEYRMSRIEGGQPPAAAGGDASPPAQARPASPAAGGAPPAAAGPAPSRRQPAPPPAARGGSPPEGSAEEQYAYAFGLLRQANYPAAEVALQEFLRRHPDDKLAENARYWLGETYYVRRDYVKAAETFLEAYQKSKTGPKAADSLLKLGMALGQLGKKEEACTTFRELDRAIPDAPERVKEKSRQERNRLGCR
jgi:tol-pal system protein YbgF